ncbi:filamentous hemagglutinin N-terminal domain-containing protein [Aerosakkonema sp. BLCC-F183]|uniref:two-partner secretion domain-containing protein n=1 Tax=Aerosakkonema sp. BLCC-F183 TaxID=3342834 RepID=UPI0035BB2D81
MQKRSPYAQISLLAYPKIGLKLWLASSLALCYWGWGGEVRSQIAPDGTLSTNVTTTDNLNFTINEGDRAGNNLFHSFREFSVPTGGEAFFNNVVDIQNIFSRVTGLSISNIDGLIRANGTANLFLINPNGIIFGPNAKLNIGGSFLGSTANSIKFGDGVEFSATNSQAAPLLSINVPIGLQYGNNPGEIRVQGKSQELPRIGTLESFDSSLNPLEVLPGKSLTLVGGNVIIDGGIIQAPGGRVELGGIAGEGTVGINADGSLSFPDEVTGETPVPQADVSIRNKAGINVLASGGGSIEINARNINILEKSLLSAGIGANLESNRPAGDITLNATEAIGVNSSRIENEVNQNAYGNSGNIEITAKSISVTGGAQLSASTRGKGDAGSVKITASDVVSFDGGVDKFRSAAFSTVEAGGEGKGGGIEITAKSVAVTDGAGLSASTFGKGDAGSVKITASDVVSFDGVSSAAFSTVEKGGEGNGGGIEITAKSVSVTRGARLNASTFGSGDAGSVKITASDIVFFDGRVDGFSSAAFSDVEKGAQGKGGGIEITAKSVSFTGGAGLDASTSGKGDGGSVKITASDIVSFDGRVDGVSSGARSTVGEGAEGKGGGIEISAKSVSVTRGARLIASTLGKGDAGSLKITASDVVSFDGRVDGFSSAAFSTVEQGAQGKGGGIEITAKSVSVTGGARLDASTLGSGDAGSVKITASDVVSFDGGVDEFTSAAISNVEKGGEGKGGGIEINAKSVSVTRGAQLTAITRGKGDAGSVKITATDVVSFDGGVDTFRSSAGSTVGEGAQGKGGGIEISAKSVSVTGGAALDANTLGKGDAGSIEITAKSVSVTGGAQLQAFTRGKGDAGSVKITASDLVSFDGGDAFSTVEKEGEGNAGDVEITAKSVSVTGGAQLQALTRGKGDAGSVKITASDVVSFDGIADGFRSAAYSTVEEAAQGKGGGIEITTGSLTISNGAELNATSAGNGSAGEIVVKADSILLENQASVISNTTKGSGNIKLDAPVITLRSSGITTNATGGDSGGNIQLGSQFLQLRDGSRIATDASGADVKGGNITINTDVLAALENSDISANSKNSLGGNVIINAQAIFGAQSRTRAELETLLNTKDATLDPSNLLTSDITATGADSFSSGSVAVNTPDVDPSAGLVALPDNVVNITSLVVSVCRPSSKEENRLIVAGRGGLPPNPLEPISPNAIWIDLRTSSNSELRSRRTEGQRVFRELPVANTQIVEAQGWIFNAQGEVELIAQAPTATPHNSGFAQQQCHAP